VELFAFFWLLVLLALVTAMISRFSRISSAAANLNLPYALWLCFAGYLNMGVYLLNG
jgi:benzodiazapine receptor